MALYPEQYRTRRPANTEKDILTKRTKRQGKKLFGVSIKNGDQIPEHLIIEILSRLPVKALLQFKSVCKLWYGIIKSSHFISKHLRNYYDTNNWRDCLIVQYSVTQLGKLDVFKLLIDDTKNRAFSYNRIDTPFDNSYLCGPCDGMNYVCSFRSSIPKRSLWNPALNEFKRLPDITCWNPNLATNSAYVYENGYGFGYDSKTKDYKVIIILGYGSPTTKENSETTDNPKSILIYSLRTNSWRYWGDMDRSYNFESNKSYVFVTGCYYWLASRLLPCGWSFDMIVSFDISADTCQEIPMPKFETRPAYGSQLIVYRDSIAFVSVPKDNTICCVWTWNEGVWTRKFSMKLDSGVMGAFTLLRDNMLVFSQRYRKLVLCDTNTKEIFVLDDPQASGCENICAYKESLVSIKDFGKNVT
ncbi:putative F-box protein At3g21120 [Silene latifolia]|uniref:putative F-box protein At3g21120 n=1 Tax=Silene latifolia TaxID=37657 RepID=UPI003D77E2E0